MFDVEMADNLFNMMFQRKMHDDGHLTTTCVISEVVDTEKHGPERYSRVAESTVTLNSKEKDCKAVGFKYALTKALQDGGFNKYERIAFWNKYLDVWGSKL